MVIEIKNVTKKFGDTIAVKNLNLKIKDKEFMTLLGPSGSGKSTTLRLVAGLEFPTEGEIYMGGEDITYVHPKDRKMSMIFQSYALYPHMTAFNNIAFPLKMKKIPKQEIRKKVKKTAEILKIEHLLKRKPKELSGGEKQRVAVGRAIIKEPEVFLMDEPLSNVDAKLRTHLRGELKKLQKELRITTIYVTHDQIEAMSMSDRIAAMDEGVLHQVSEPDELYKKPSTSFVAGFIGSPPMNLINCSLLEKNGRIFLDAGPFTINVSNFSGILSETTSSELMLGVRPEDISLSLKAKRKPDFIASVHTVEPLGLEKLVSLIIGDKLLRVRTLSDFIISSGEKVGVCINKQRMYIFDAKSGKRINWGENKHV